MRFIYVDEAGTSELEPTTVVVGIIVDADKQLIAAEHSINEILGAVPKQALKPDGSFQFHATEIWNKKEYREYWSQAARLALLHKMMALPRMHGISISMARINRNADPQERFKGTGLSRAQFQHMLAFSGCLAMADRYVRDYAHQNEIATVVAEDVPEMRRFLEDATSKWRDSPLILAPEHIRPTQQEETQGFVEQHGEFRITRIRRGIHFVKKGNECLLQLADACAFGFRRFFAEQEFGEAFIKSMLGGELNRQDFLGPSSFCTYRHKPI